MGVESQPSEPRPEDEWKVQMGPGETNDEMPHEPVHPETNGPLAAGSDSKVVVRPHRASEPDPTGPPYPHPLVTLAHAGQDRCYVALGRGETGRTCCFGRDMNAAPGPREDATIERCVSISSASPGIPVRGFRTERSHGSPKCGFHGFSPPGFTRIRHLNSLELAAGFTGFGRAFHG